MYGEHAHRTGPPRLELTESAAGLSVTTTSLADLPGMIADGTIRAMSSVAAIYRTLAHLEAQ